MAGYYDFEDVRSMNTGPICVEEIEEGKVIRVVKAIVKYTIITACTVVCMYLLFDRAQYYAKYETTVSVNIRFVQELRQLLPGITLCSGSL